MYLFDQIIIDTDSQKVLRINDVWDTSQYPLRDSHLVYAKTGKIFIGGRETGNEVTDKVTLEKAQAMFDAGELVIPPKSKDHCADCGNWYTNPPRKGLYRGRQAPPCTDKEHAEKYAAYLKEYYCDSCGGYYPYDVDNPHCDTAMLTAYYCSEPLETCTSEKHRERWECYASMYLSMYGEEQWAYHYSFGSYRYSKEACR